MFGLGALAGNGAAETGDSPAVDPVEGDLGAEDAPVGSQATLRVCEKDRVDCHTDSIQEALDFAAKGDTILVENGTYVEEDGLDIQVPDVTLVAEQARNPDANETVIETPGTDDENALIAIEVADELGEIRVEGVTVAGTWQIGAIVQGVSAQDTTLHVENVTIEAPQDTTTHGNSIQIAGDGSTVTDSTVETTHQVSPDWAASGILAYSATNATITDIEVVCTNDDDIGIGVGGGQFGFPDSANVAVEGNTVRGCAAAVFLQGVVDGGQIADNELTESRWGIGTSSDAGGLTGISVTGNAFEDNGGQVDDDADAFDLREVLGDNQFDAAVVVAEELDGNVTSDAIYAEIRPGLEDLSPDRVLEAHENTLDDEPATYTEAESLVLDDAGATVASVPAGGAVLHADQSPVFEIPAEEVTVTGFNVSNLPAANDATQGAVADVTGDDVTLEALEVHNDAAAGPYPVIVHDGTSGVSLLESTFLEADRSERIVKVDPGADDVLLEENHLAPIGPEEKIGGFWILSTENVTLRDNTVEDSWGEGITISQDADADETRATSTLTLEGNNVTLADASKERDFREVKISLPPAELNGQTEAAYLSHDDCASLVTDANDVDSVLCDWLRVLPGETIQPHVDLAVENATVEVENSTYHEPLVLDVDGFTLETVEDDDGARLSSDAEPVLEIPADGVTVRGFDLFELPDRGAADIASVANVTGEGTTLSELTVVNDVGAGPYLVIAHDEADGFELADSSFEASDRSERVVRVDSGVDDVLLDGNRFAPTADGDMIGGPWILAYQDVEITSNTIEQAWGEGITVSQGFGADVTDDEIRETSNLTLEDNDVTVAEATRELGLADVKVAHQPNTLNGESDETAFLDAILDANQIQTVDLYAQWLRVAEGWSVQDFVDAADDQATVRVGEGTYEERVDVTSVDGLTLDGAGSDVVTIDASQATWDGLDANYATDQGASDVSLEGFTLVGPPDRYGIKAAFIDGFTVEDVHVTDSGITGLDLHTVDDATIDGVEATSNGGNGIAVRNAEDVTLADVSTEDNAWGGLALYAPGDERVSDLTVSESTFENEAAGIYLQYADHEDIVVENTTLSDNDLGFAVLEFDAGDGVITPENATIELREVNLTGNDEGVRNEGIVDLTVEASQIEGNEQGVVNSAPGAEVFVRANGIHENGIGVLNTENAFLVIEDNQIQGNDVGVQNDAFHEIQATANWWGAPTGPAADETPRNTGADLGLFGDRVEGNVDFDPWCADEGCAVVIGASADVDPDRLL